VLALVRAGGSSHRPAVHGVKALGAKALGVKALGVNVLGVNVLDVKILGARIRGAMGPFVLSFFHLRRGASEVRG
jgi:hypothetical protein